MKRCTKCKSLSIINRGKDYYCTNCGWDSESSRYARRVTNADRIRSMRDDELAKFLASKDSNFFVNTTCYQCGFFNKHVEICNKPRWFVCNESHIEKLVRLWLQKEVLVDTLTENNKGVNKNEID